MRFLLATTLLFSSIAECEEAEDASKIKAAIGQLSSDDFKTRQAADMALRKAGAAALPFLREAKPADVEGKKRVNDLLQLWPPMRPNRTPNEVVREGADKVLPKLYDEWCAEKRRLAVLMKDGYARTKFLGDIDSNLPLIARDRTWVLRFNDKEPFAVFEQLYKTRAEETVELERGSTWTLSPLKFLLTPERFGPAPDDDIADARWRLQLASQQKTPPTAEEWQQLRQDLRRLTSGERVSMVFQRAQLADVLTTIAIQSSHRIFFDPPALFDEVRESEVTTTMDDTPWDEALNKILEANGLTASVEGSGTARHAVIRRTEKK